MSNRQPLRDYQIAGAAFLATRDRALLGDDTGLGKSRQVIAAAAVRGSERVLVLCPAIGRVSWRSEFARWQDKLPVWIDLPGRKQAPPPPATGPLVVVVSYDAISRRSGARRVSALLRAGQPFDLVVLDEAHYLKNPNATRTREVYGTRLDLIHSLIQHALAPGGAVWALSATIQKSAAADLYPHLMALMPEVITSIFGRRVSPGAFAERFCFVEYGDYGRIVTGNNPFTMPELTRAMRPYVLARRKSDVAPELGAIQYVTLPLDVDVPDDVLYSFPSDGTEFLDRWESTPIDGDFGRPPLTIMERWRILGEHKVDPALAWITDFLDADPDRKLIVFAHHRVVVEGIAAAFPPDECAMLHGGTSPGDRTRAVNNFQNNPRCRLFVGQTLAAGTSITLTAASDVLVVEPEWAPADTYQAISRCHRLGQTEPVTARFVFAAETVDERIAQVARRKTEDFERLMAGLSGGKNIQGQGW